MLMGVLLRDQIMQGPDTASNIAGWTYHVWNSGMFGVTYAVLLGGFPFRRFGGAVAGTLMGTGYGLALGTGFLLSPVPKAVGAGVFGTDFGAKFAITVYLAHAGFGACWAGWCTATATASPHCGVWPANCCRPAGSVKRTTENRGAGVKRPAGPVHRLSRRLEAPRRGRPRSVPASRDANELSCPPSGAGLEGRRPRPGSRGAGAQPAPRTHPW